MIDDWLKINKTCFKVSQKDAHEADDKDEEWECGAAQDNGEHCLLYWGQHDPPAIVQGS